MAKHTDNSRRNLLLGGLAVGAAAAMIKLKPSDQGENHADYFVDLSQALDRAGIARPVMVIDKQKLKQNVQVMRSHIGQRFAYRIVAKSLPSVDLIKAVMAEANTSRLMLFYQPFANQIAEQIPHADILFGKPMPVAAAHNFYRQLRGNFNPAKQLQWLIDSPQRLQQYADLAKQLDVSMRISIEIDVGLHRGGVDNVQDLSLMLEQIQASQHLQFSGFMGYEPHIAKLPGSKIKLRDQAMQVYQEFVELAAQKYGGMQAEWVLNAGGSPSYQLYDQGSFPFNELSTGSCLVKPTDFDLSTLADHLPAAYIATPVIKTMAQSRLPGFDSLAKLMRWWNPNRQQAFFTYGGYWKAKPESPKGLSTNPLFGRSTNQEMLNGSKRVNLQQDDWVFLRPTQSEFVFLQFGDLAVYDQGEMVASWPVMKQS